MTSYRKLQLQIILIFHIYCAFCDDFDFINLPETHLPIYFNTFPHIAAKCAKESRCEYNSFLQTDHNKDLCWGYERSCRKQSAYSQHRCPGDHHGFVESKKAHLDTFYSQADFGYVRDHTDDLIVMCEPFLVTDSSLECTQYLRYCRGRNIMVNFTDLIHRKEPMRYKMDVLKQGQIAGKCQLHKARLTEQIQHVSPLQSWAPELRFFEELQNSPIENEKCDVIVERPTYFLKIDATNNMYHHFCDFFNLYASLHMNMTNPRAFSSDVNILVWESYTYWSYFSSAMSAFTDHPVMDLKSYMGKNVCFKNLVLPFLPRMIFGLYYNTPIIQGCENSGLFHAFSEFMLHRLGIKQMARKTKRIRITFLSRKTKYRQVLNEEILLTELWKTKKYDVQNVAFGSNISFRDQLKVIQNTDILIGMHGAGLTHLLFLPKWGALFELYNCEDASCYRDLARLRGVYYQTWNDTAKLTPEDDGQHPDGGKHAKFTNYSFDPEEFVRLVAQAARHVEEHQDFQNYISPKILSKNEL